MVRGAGNLVLVLVVLFATRAASAQDAVPAAAKAQADRLLAEKLKSRAQEWMTARYNLVTTCTGCSGSGSIRVGLTTRVCSKCSGGGRMLSPTQAQKILYDMRTPAFRATPNAQAVATAEFRKWRLADAGRLAPRSWRFVRSELVDATRGIVWIAEGAAKDPTPSYWVLADKTWWLWTESADGPWDSPPSPGEPLVAGMDVPGAEPLPNLLGISVTAALEKVVTAAKVSSKARAGRTLLLVLDFADPSPQFDAMVVSDSIAVVRAIYGAMPADWDAVRMVYTCEWQDKFGERVRAPLWAVSMTAEVYRRIRWDNLDEGGVWALFFKQKESRESLRIVTR